MQPSATARVVKSPSREILNAQRHDGACAPVGALCHGPHTASTAPLPHAAVKAAQHPTCKPGDGFVKQKIVTRSLVSRSPYDEQLSIRLAVLYSTLCRLNMPKYSDCAHAATQELENGSTAFLSCRNSSNMLLLLFLGYGIVWCMSLTIVCQSQCYHMGHFSCLLQLLLPQAVQGQAPKGDWRWTKTTYS